MFRGIVLVNVMGDAHAALHKKYTSCTVQLYIAALFSIWTHWLHCTNVRNSCTVQMYTKAASYNCT